MHTYYVFHFTHLHVSVPLDHFQGTFVTEYIIATMCRSNVQVNFNIFNIQNILCRYSIPL
jgi:hypothetical protein